MNKYLGTSTLESMGQAKFYNRWTFNKFKIHLKGEILEIGAGIGNFTSDLSKYGKVTAIDIEPNFIRQINERKNPYVTAGLGDIQKGKFFFGAKTFESIVCLNILEHIEDDSGSLENIFKLLKRDGNLILLVPIYESLYGEIDKSIGHFRRYDPLILMNQMKDQGFKIIYKRKLNLVGALGWFIAGRIFKNKRVEGNQIQLFNVLSPFFLFFEDIIEPFIGTSILIIAKK